MMRVSRSWMLVVPALIGLSVTLGCQPEGTGAISDQTVSGDMSDLPGLVAKTQVHHRRPFRKPYRDERNRTMRLLAEKTEILLANLGTPTDAQALTGTVDEDGQLRSALQDLQDAARRKSVSGVASSYARVKASRN